MSDNKNELKLYVLNDFSFRKETSIEEIVYDLDCQIDQLKSKADTIDYIVSAASGVLCALLDILWVGEFSLSEGRSIAEEKVDGIVKKTAKLLGCEDEDLKSCVNFLEKNHIPADGNSSDFGGGLQHHLRDFAHHPTITGLIFSILTQFTGKSFGTDVNGTFIAVPVPDTSIKFIGKDIPSKIFNGTVKWFFHLVSDMAGSSNTVGLSGGTGIPGPILSLAKELSSLDIFKNAKIGDNSLSQFLSKLFNGTLFAKRDAEGKIIKDTIVKFDLRGELGSAIELSKQAVPVIANECIVRGFYFIRRLIWEIKDKKVNSLKDMQNISWKDVAPYKNPTLSRMLLISTGVFTTVDITEAIVSQKYWISVNYVGVCRFALAVGSEISWGLKRNDIKKIKRVYETIQSNTFNIHDNREYGRLQSYMTEEKLGLTLEQTEILYNIECLKTKNDIEKERNEKVKELKEAWLTDWKTSITEGFPSFVKDKTAELHWYTYDFLIKLIEEIGADKTWFKLVLLETMLFEPYFPLKTELNKKGKEVPNKKYDSLKLPTNSFKDKEGDIYLEEAYSKKYLSEGFIKRLRKCHKKVLRELNEVIKVTLIGVAITAATIIATIISAGALAPEIAVALVGSSFTELSGAALTSACLAYLGGGAIAAGGLGMTGGMAVIVGGGAVLDLGIGASAGGITAGVKLNGKREVIKQSAKLMVSVQEIFINQEKDVEYSNTIYEQYIDNIVSLETELARMKVSFDTAPPEEKKKMKKEIKNTKESIDAMKIARKNMIRFISSYQEGIEKAS